MPLPYDRARLAQGGGALAQPVPTPALVERLDEGWSSILLAMMRDDLGRLEFGTADGTPGYAAPRPSSAPATSPRSRSTG